MKTDLQRDGLGTVVVSSNTVAALQFVIRPVHIPAHLDVVVQEGATAAATVVVATHAEYPADVVER